LPSDRGDEAVRGGGTSLGPRAEGPHVPEGKPRTREVLAHAHHGRRTAEGDAAHGSADEDAGSAPRTLRRVGRRSAVDPGNARATCTGGSPDAEHVRLRPDHSRGGSTPG